MKRWTIRISICLLLGAITTVAIAWGIVLSRPVYNPALTTQRYLAHDDCLLDCYTFIAPGTRHYFVYAFPGAANDEWFKDQIQRSDLPSWVPLSKIASDRRMRTNRPFGAASSSIARGWPWRTLFNRYIRPNSNPDSIVQAAGLEGGLFVDDPSDYERVVLPLQPIWPAFLASVGMWGAAWWLIVFAPFAVRRWYRDRFAGCCPNCKYDLRGNLDTGCPECGWGRAEDGKF